MWNSTNSCPKPWGCLYDQISALSPIRKSDLYIVLDGVVEPDLKNDQLRKKYQVTGNEQLIEKIFLAGEIENISSEILILSGYGNGSVKKLEKNSESVQG